MLLSNSRARKSRSRVIERARVLSAAAVSVVLMKQSTSLPAILAHGNIAAGNKRSERMRMLAAVFLRQCMPRLVSAKSAGVKEEMKFQQYGVSRRLPASVIDAEG